VLYLPGSPAALSLLELRPEALRPTLSDGLPFSGLEIKSIGYPGGKIPLLDSASDMPGGDQKKFEFKGKNVSLVLSSFSQILFFDESFFW
jgi:hypothetical protein